MNPPAVWHTWVPSLCWEVPLEEGMATHSRILAWRIPMERGAWCATVHGATKSQTQLSDQAQHIQRCKSGALIPKDLTSLLEEELPDLSRALSLCLHTHTEEMSCEETEGRWPTAIQEECLHQELNLLAPWSWTSGIPNYEKLNVFCLSHPACGIWFWQLEQTNTGPITKGKKKKLLSHCTHWLPETHPGHSCFNTTFLGTCRFLEILLRTVQYIFYCNMLPFRIVV